ncbi:MAG: hypothetical protein V2A74_12910 [bacterium]
MGDLFGQGWSQAFSRHDFVELIFWCFGFLAAIIVLFIVSKWIKAGVTRRVTRLSVFGMGFDDLEHMKRSGLISEDEIKMVRRRMSERILEAAKEDKVGDKNRFLAEQLAQQLAAGSSAPGSDNQAPWTRPRGPVPPDLVPSQGGSPTHAPPQTPVVPHSSKVKSDLSSGKSSGAKPVDLDSLRQKGIISDEEYQRLRDFFEEKKSGGAT